MNIDMVVLLSATASFIFFLVVHVIVLRTLTRFPAPISFLVSIACGLLINVTLFYQFETESISALNRLFAAGVSLLIYLFLILHYLAFIFGMSEASIRVRLLIEVGNASSKGISSGEILGRYNAKQILNVRLGRLISAGHFKFDGTYYSIKSKILLLQLFLINLFKTLLGIERERN